MDGTTGAFDWTVDLASADPHGVIVVDDDPAWADPDTGIYGAVTAKVTEAGLYFITFRVLAGAPSQAGDFVFLSTSLRLLNASGGQLIDEGMLGREALFSYPGEWHNLGGSCATQVTMYLPANAHIDVRHSFNAVLAGAAATDRGFDLIVKRVG